MRARLLVWLKQITCPHPITCCRYVGLRDRWWGFRIVMVECEKCGFKENSKRFRSLKRNGSAWEINGN